MLNSNRVVHQLCIFNKIFIIVFFLNIPVCIILIFLNLTLFNFLKTSSCRGNGWMNVFFMFIYIFKMSRVYFDLFTYNDTKSVLYTWLFCQISHCIIYRRNHMRA